MKKTIFALLMAFLLPISVLMAQTIGENIDVTHYEIHVNDLNFVDRTMQAETFVDLVATASVQQIVLELKSLDVSSVTAIGATISSFAQISDYLMINMVSPLANGASATFDIVNGGIRIMFIILVLVILVNHLIWARLGFHVLTTSPTRLLTMFMSRPQTTRKQFVVAFS